MPDDQVTELKVAIAELRIDLRHLAHDIKNALQGQQAFVPRHEISSKHADFDERISAIESNQTWAARAIIGAWIAGAGVVAFGKRILS